jgi:ATP-dependent protease ClpP protease subunit
MKKLVVFLAMLAAMFVVTTVSFSEPASFLPEQKSSGICPKTNVEGGVHDCLICHTKVSFELKEINPFASWDIPGSDTEMMMLNGEPVGVYNIEDYVTGYVGSSMDEFFQYLNSYHPEVKKVIVNIHSGGGSLFGGYQAVGVMRKWYDDFEIETRVNGFAASAAFFIFCGGETRLVSPGAELMWHELITFSMFEVSGPSDKEDQAEVLRHLQDTANLMLAEISVLTKGQLDEKVRKKEYWMRGTEAVELGFATGFFK